MENICSIRDSVDRPASQELVAPRLLADVQREQAARSAVFQKPSRGPELEDRAKILAVLDEAEDRLKEICASVAGTPEEPLWNELEQASNAFSAEAPRLLARESPSLLLPRFVPAARGSPDAGRPAGCRQLCQGCQGRAAGLGTFPRAFAELHRAARQFLVAGSGLRGADGAAGGRHVAPARGPGQRVEPGFVAPAGEPGNRGAPLGRQPGQDPTAASGGRGTGRDRRQRPRPSRGRLRPAPGSRPDRNAGAGTQRRRRSALLQSAGRRLVH